MFEKKDKIFILNGAINSCKEDNINKLTTYINENAVGVTLLVTVFVGIATPMVNFLYFANKTGYLSYFNYGSSAISLIEQNKLFDFLLNASILGVFIAGCFISMFQLSAICANKGQFIVKTIFFIVEFLKMIFCLTLLFIPVSLLMIPNTININYSTGPFYLSIILLSFIFSIAINITVLISLSFNLIGLIISHVVKVLKPKIKNILIYIPKDICFFINEFKTTKRNIKIFKRSIPSWVKTLCFLLFIYIITLCAIYWSGYTQAQLQTNFKLLDKNFLVIYETNHDLYLAEYEVLDNENSSIKINPYIQKTISKTNIELSVRTCNKVEVMARVPKIIQHTTDSGPEPTKG